MQWNYASFNVTLNYLMHEMMEFCATSSLALDNWEQKYCQTIRTLCREEDYFPKGKFKLFNSLFHSVASVQLFFFKKFAFYLDSIGNLVAVRYLWEVCNVDKCCVVTQGAADIHVAWLVYLACSRSHVLRAHCNFESKQAKTSELDYFIWAAPKQLRPTQWFKPAE